MNKYAKVRKEVLWVRYSVSATAAVWLALGGANAGVLRVKADAPGPVQDGASWETAYRAVPDALSAATAGDEVWVAAGQYIGRITVTAEVGLYGGFAGTETARDERDPAARETVLDSAGLGRVVTFPIGATAATVLDGFTIRNAPVGVHCYRSSPTISRNRITSIFQYGIVMGGTAADPAAPRIEGNTISNNECGIYCDDDSRPAITGNRIAENGSDELFFEGGGIWCGRGTGCIITGNLITGNRAWHGAGVFADGRDITIANNVFSRNVARSGGGIYGGVIIGEIVNNTLVDNEGGGLLMESGWLTIANNTFAFNDYGLRDLEGGCFPSDYTLRNNAVFGNRDADYMGIADPTGADGNLRADPQFVNRAASDYHLCATSPLIDAGDNAFVQGYTDRDGNPRVVGARVDIGAYEAAFAAITMGDACGALRAWAGLSALAPGMAERLNVAEYGSSGAVDLADVLRLARMVAGLVEGPS